MEAEDHYIVNDLGAEVTNIAAPVSICMVLTIALVRLLNAAGDSSDNAVAFAEAIYSEKVRGFIKLVTAALRALHPCSRLHCLLACSLTPDLDRP